MAAGCTDSDRARYKQRCTLLGGSEPSGQPGVNAQVASCRALSSCISSYSSIREPFPWLSLSCSLSVSHARTHGHTHAHTHTQSHRLATLCMTQALNSFCCCFFFIAYTSFSETITVNWLRSSSPHWSLSRCSSISSQGHMKFSQPRFGMLERNKSCGFICK